MKALLDPSCGAFVYLREKATRACVLLPHGGLNMRDDGSMDIDRAMEQAARVSPGDPPEAESVREQLAVEMEQQLIAQEQVLEGGTGVPIVEQDDGLDTRESLSSDVISLSPGVGASGAQNPDDVVGDETADGLSGAQTDHGMDNAAFTDPGAGTAPDSSHIREGDYDELADLDN